MRMQVLARSGFAARHDWEGVYATADARTPRDVAGRTLPVRFTIIDRRPLPGNATRGPYSVAVSLQVSRTAGMPDGGRRNLTWCPSRVCTHLDPLLVHDTGSGGVLRFPRLKRVECVQGVVEGGPPSKGCAWFYHLQGVGTAEMNAGDEPVIGISSSFQEPGTYTLEVGVNFKCAAACADVSQCACCCP